MGGPDSNICQNFRGSYDGARGREAGQTGYTYLVQPCADIRAHDKLDVLDLGLHEHDPHMFCLGQVGNSILTDRSKISPIPTRPAVSGMGFGRVENLNPDPYPAKPYPAPTRVYKTHDNPYMSVRFGKIPFSRFPGRRRNLPGFESGSDGAAVRVIG